MFCLSVCLRKEKEKPTETPPHPSTRLLPGGTKELAKNLLQASGSAVEVKLGHKLVNVATDGEKGGVSLTMRVMPTGRGDGEGAAAEAAAAAESAEEQKSSSQRRIANGGAASEVGFKCAPYRVRREERSE